MLLSPIHSAALQWGQAGQPFVPDTVFVWLHVSLARVNANGSLEGEFQRCCNVPWKERKQVAPDHPSRYDSCHLSRRRACFFLSFFSPHFSWCSIPLDFFFRHSGQRLGLAKPKVRNRAWSSELKTKGSSH